MSEFVQWKGNYLMRVTSPYSIESFQCTNLQGGNFKMSVFT